MRVYGFGASKVHHSSHGHNRHVHDTRSRSGTLLPMRPKLTTTSAYLVTPIRQNSLPPRLKYSPMASLLAKSQRNCERPTYSCTECPLWRNATARALAWLHCLSSRERIHAPDYWRRGPLPIRIWRTNNWGRRTFLYARVSHKTVYFRGGNNGQCVQHNLLQEPHYEAI